MQRREDDDPARHARPTMNMTPMIDVTFQLIVVFLCSMKFRTLDQKIEARLPRDVGTICTLDPRVETRLTVQLRAPRGAPGAAEVRLLGTTLGRADDPAVWIALRRDLEGIRARAPEAVAEIDASNDVAHAEVVQALDTFLAAGMGSVRFRANFDARRPLPSPPPPR